MQLLVDPSQQTSPIGAAEHFARSLSTFAQEVPPAHGNIIIAATQLL